MTQIPPDGQWPCQTDPEARSARLVGFLYVLLRQGATAPGDVEQIALNLRETAHDAPVSYTNEHLARYAAALATFLAPRSSEPSSGVQLTDAEANTLHAYVMGDHFTPEGIDAAMQKLAPAYERTLAGDDDDEDEA